MLQGSHDDKDHKKIKDLQKEVEETKEIMLRNIEKVLANGAHLEELVDATAELKHESQLFSQQANELAVEMYFRNYLIPALMIGFALGLLYGFFAGYSLAASIALGVVGLGAGYAALRAITTVKEFLFRHTSLEGISDNIASKVSHLFRFEPSPSFTPHKDEKTRGHAKPQINTDVPDNDAKKRLVK